MKTHAGANTEFHRLVRGDGRVNEGLRAFLSSAYNFKTLADYETGPGSEVSPEKAAEAIATAKCFVAKMVEIIEGNT